MLCSSLAFISVTAVQIIPAQVSTPTAIKVLKQSRGPRAPRISGEERSSPGNRTGSSHHTHRGPQHSLVTEKPVLKGTDFSKPPDKSSLAAEIVH